MDKDALQDILAQLHEETAKQLLKRISSGTAAPADFMAAIRFLKENDISAVVQPGSPAADLARMVPFPTSDDTEYPH
ncbi:MAG TPA: hypothetical protein VNR89_04120 [Roseomonas sp.]|nr:hypothetical protein [Roseomonas sp.]